MTAHRANVALVGCLIVLMGVGLWSAFQLISGWSIVRAIHELDQVETRTQAARTVKTHLKEAAPLIRRELGSLSLQGQISALTTAVAADREVGHELLQYYLRNVAVQDSDGFLERWGQVVSTMDATNVRLSPSDVEPWLRASRPFLRCAALQMIRFNKGDLDSLRVAISAFEDSDQGVRRAAISTTGWIATDEYTRKLALDAIGRLLERDNLDAEELDSVVAVTVAMQDSGGLPILQSILRDRNANEETRACAAAGVLAAQSMSLREAMSIPSEKRVQMAIHYLEEASEHEEQHRVGPQPVGQEE